MNEIIDTLEPEKVYEAITEGVRQGIMSIVHSGTDMPSADFYDHVKLGVKEAVESMTIDCPNRT